MKINLIVAWAMFSLIGIAFCADSALHKAKIYGMWEIDIEDRGVFQEDVAFIEMAETFLSFYTIEPNKNELINKTNVWWISQNGNLFYSQDGKIDNLVMFLDDNTVRFEIGRMRIVLRRSSKERLETARKERKEFQIAQEKRAAISMAEQEIYSAVFHAVQEIFSEEDVRDFKDNKIRHETLEAAKEIAVKTANAAMAKRDIQVVFNDSDAAKVVLNAIKYKVSQPNENARLVQNKTISPSAAAIAPPESVAKQNALIQTMDNQTINVSGRNLTAENAKTLLYDVWEVVNREELYPISTPPHITQIFYKFTPEEVLDWWFYRARHPVSNSSKIDWIPQNDKIYVSYKTTYFMPTMPIVFLDENTILWDHYPKQKKLVRSSQEKLDAFLKQTGK